MEIGTKIRELRIRNNYTQEEMAQKLNVTPQAVSRWENNISLPDITMISLLCSVLNTTADNLINPSSQTHRLFDSCNNLVLSGNRLNQDQIDSLYEDRDFFSDRTPKKVLVADDSDFMRMMLKDMLSKIGHFIVEADNGKAAIKVCEIEKPDVCIIDINMPEMNGLDVLKYLASEQKNVRVLMLSALCEDSIVQEAKMLGATSFVAKPFQPDSIIKRV